VRPERSSANAPERAADTAGLLGVDAGAPELLARALEGALGAAGRYVVAAIRLEPSARFLVPPQRLQRARHQQIRGFVVGTARHGGRGIAQCARKIARALGAARALQIVPVVIGIGAETALEGGLRGSGSVFGLAHGAANRADARPNFRAVRVLGVGFLVGRQGLAELAVRFVFDAQQIGRVGLGIDEAPLVADTAGHARHAARAHAAAQAQYGEQRGQ